MNRLKWIGLAAVATGTALTASFLVSRTSPSTTDGPVSETASLAPEKTAPHAPQVIASPRASATASELPLAGRHRVEYAVSLGSEAGTPGAMAQVRLTAQLSLSTVDKADGRWLVGALTNGELRGAPGAAPQAALAAGAAEVVEAFGGAVAIRVLESGAFAELRVDPRLPARVQATLPAVLRAGQLVHDAKGTAATWVVDEDGVNTRYRATYERKTGALDKRWETLADSADASSYTESGSAHFAFSGLAVSGLAARQRGRIDLHDPKGGALVFDATTTWERIGDADDQVAGAIDLDQLVVFDREQYAASSTDRTARLVDEAGVDALVAKIGEASADARWQDRHAIGSELAAGIARDDRLVTRVAALARAADDEPTRRTLLEALAGAATPAAQKELMAYAADRMVGADARTQALGALTFIQTPTADLLAGLEAEAYSSQPEALPAAAVVTLGAALRWDLDARKAGTSVVASRFAAEATARLRANRVAGVVTAHPPDPGTVHPTPDPDAATPKAAAPPAAGEERREWTRAVGNAALPELAPVLIELLQDPDEYVRTAAAFSARFYDPGPLLAALPDVLANDDSILVRAAVAQACQFLGPASCETMIRKAIRNDPSARVRESAAYTVATWLQDTPGLASILQEALAEEKSPEVAETLKNYLYPGRVSSPFQLKPNPGAMP